MKRLVVMLGAAMLAVLSVRGEDYGAGCCGDYVAGYYICWGSDPYDYFRYGDHRPYPDSKPGSGYDAEPGCCMLFTDLLVVDPLNGVGWMGPTVDTPCTVYRDGVAIATVGTVGGYNWFTDCDVVPGRTYTYEITAKGCSTGPMDVSCSYIYRADIETNEVVFSADGGSRKVGIAMYTDYVNDSIYDPYILFGTSVDADWIGVGRKENLQRQYTSFVVSVDENTNDVPRECVVTIEYEGFKWPVRVRQDAKGLAEGEMMVAFDGNGGEPSVLSAAFEVGGQYGSLPTATLDGYRFVGWSTRADGGLLIDEDSIVSEETTTLYAVWKSEAEPIWTIEAGVLTAVELNGATDIEIPRSVTSIGTNVFEECSGLRGVVIPGNVANIGGYAFFSCSLERVIFANGLVDIGEFAFWSCDGLHGVTFPNTLKTVGTRAFYSCNGLTDIDIPASLDDIAQEAFSQCPNLAAFSVAPGNTAFSAVGGILYDKPGTTVVYVPNALTAVELPEGVGRIAEWAFAGCRKLNSLTLPSTLTDIESHAFTQCSRLSAVTIPVNVSCIGKMAFWLCSGLVSIDVAPGNAVFSSYDGCLYENGGKNLHTVPGGKSEVALLPDAVAINDCACYSCGKLVAVTLPDTLESIGSSAFRYCRLLTSITIPAGVARIETGAFSDCSGLASVTYLGACPETGTSIYAGTPEDLVSIVPAVGWEDALTEGTWQGRGIRLARIKVTFGKNGGTGGDNYVTATYGAAMPTPRTAPTQSGWTFAGYWDTVATDANGNAKGKQYYDANMKSVRNWDKASTATLWAKWTNKVTLGKNGGTGGDNYVTCTKGQPMPKRTMPTKSGYVFGGYWNTTGAGGIKYYNADGTSAHAWDRSGNVTLWAKWEKAVTVKVTFGKNGGTGGDNYVTATTGKAMPTPRTAPTRAGWTFDGYWDTLAQDANGNPTGKQYYDANMKSVRNWDKPSAVTLWAKWTVRVKLGKNGGTGGDDEVVVTYNQPFPKRTMPTRTGYTFGGYWISSSSKTGPCYNTDGTGTSTMKWTAGGSPTVWALWTPSGKSVKKVSASVTGFEDQEGGAVWDDGHVWEGGCPQPPPPDAASPWPAGLYTGVVSGGEGWFTLQLDGTALDGSRTAFLVMETEAGTVSVECEAVDVGNGIVLTAHEGGYIRLFVDGGEFVAEPRL